MLSQFAGGFRLTLVSAMTLFVVWTASERVCCAQPTASITIQQTVKQVAGLDYDSGDPLYVKSTATASVPATDPASVTIYHRLKIHDDDTPSNWIYDHSFFVVIPPGESAEFGDEHGWFAGVGVSWYYGWAQVVTSNFTTLAYQDFYFQD